MLKTNYQTPTVELLCVETYALLCGSITTPDYGDVPTDYDE